MNRRRFLKQQTLFTGALLTGRLLHDDSGSTGPVAVDAHLWVYASQFPPDWDCTPILENVFSDIRSAGYSGLEIMESILRRQDSVQKLLELSGKYKLPVTGTSYYADMWIRDERNRIIDDVSTVVERLRMAGGSMIGLTVGDAKRAKTERELDAQADVLTEIRKVCTSSNIQPNLHNHTFEVINNMHDLKGTLTRIPDMKLGPDLNWLVRAGVNPVRFIKDYGRQMVYMHLRDQDAQGQWTEAVGEGVMNFKAIAAALREINYKGRVAVELAFEQKPKRSILECWKISRTYVREVFGC